MHRRNILAGTIAAVGALFAAARDTVRADQVHAEPAPDAAKVAYHLCDLDKVAFVLGNIRNHYDGAGGPDKVTIALVVHGPALNAFHAAKAGPDVARAMGQFLSSGLQPMACGNTMRAQKVTLKDLVPGFVSADRGGVVRLAELQAQGYAYLRP
jgi:intracellular sulfur oxidation DsrE/DsrF family protein